MASSLVLAILTAAIAWRAPPAATAWTLAGVALALTVAGGWLLHRAAAENLALRAQVALGSTRLEEFSLAHGRFVDGLAHQIRTPLTIVLNQAELLVRCSDDPAAVSIHARSVADYLLHLSDLFEAFLRLAGPFVAADTSHHVAVHIHDLVIEAVRRSQSMAQSCGVSVVATIAELEADDQALEVLGSEVLLQAMIECLVRNAVRCSPRGAAVELQVLLRDDSIVLHVRDHGTGIAPSQLESVFDWYFQSPGAHQHFPGSGGVLSIARRVVDHHGGTIALRNHPDGGCEFEVALPRWRGEADTRPPSDRIQSSPHHGSPVHTLPLPRLAGARPVPTRREPSR